jgi:hypothetical protein
MKCLVFFDADGTGLNRRDGIFQALNVWLHRCRGHAIAVLCLQSGRVRRACWDCRSDGDRAMIKRQVLSGRLRLLSAPPGLLRASASVISRRLAGSLDDSGRRN